jgi:hypothetical protein
MKRLILSSVLALTMVLSVGASTAAAQNNSRQAGLVNISTGDVALLNNVNLAVAANVLVTACDLTVALAAVALQQVADTGSTTCTSATGPITIDQTQPGPGPGGRSTHAGGNNSTQLGLVNVSLGDVEILNNVNLGVAANVLVTACDLKIPVAILAVQTLVDTGETTCTSTAGPIDITQAQ